MDKTIIFLQRVLAVIIRADIISISEAVELKKQKSFKNNWLLNNLPKLRRSHKITIQLLQ
jgi:hypothetical protein